MRATSPRRRATAAAAVGLIALGAPLALTAPAGADPAPAQQPSAQTRANALPSDARAAILRDLHISPLEFIVRGDAAKTAGQVAGNLDAQLGADRFGGAWFDPAAKKLKVSVTDPAAAAVVQAAGAEPVIRSVTARQLSTAQHRLTEWARALPAEQRRLVVAVSTDQPAGTGVLRLRNTDAGRALASKVPAAAAPVSVVYSAGQITGQENLVGGEGYLVQDPQGAQAATCSLGFNAVDRKGGRYAITAGHCAEFPTTVVEAGKNPKDDRAFGHPGAPLGSFDKIELSDLDKPGGKGHDYATVAITNPGLTQQPAITDYQGGVVKLTGVADPVVGMPVCKSGRTSDYTCGSITQVQEEVYVNYSGEGPNRAGDVQRMTMFQADYCSEPGDSGAAVIAGDKAVGINDAGIPSPQDGFSCPSKFPQDGVDNEAFGQALTTDILPDFGDSLFVLTGVQAATVTSPADHATVTEARPALAGTGTRGATVTAVVDNKTVGTATVGNSGRWSIPLTTDLAPGSHTLLVKSVFSSQTAPDAHSSFTVGAALAATNGAPAATGAPARSTTPAAQPVAASKPTSARLANTGLSSMILPIGLGALVLIGGGVALVVRGRKRAGGNSTEAGTSD